MSTIQTVQEQPTEREADEARGAGVPTADSPRATDGARPHSSADKPAAQAVDQSRRIRRPTLATTAAVTIIAALIASISLAAVTAFNTLRSDSAMLREEIASLRTEMREEIGSSQSEMGQEIGSLRTEMRDEIGSLRTEMREEFGSLRTEMREEIGSLRTEIGAVRTELHEFRGEVTTVLLDHAERLARIETLILNGAQPSRSR